MDLSTIGAAHFDLVYSTLTWVTVLTEEASTLAYRSQAVTEEP